MWTRDACEDMAEVTYKLHRAAYHGDVDTVRAMLHNGYDVNSVNGKGNTALVSALIGKGKRKVKETLVNLLLDYGSDVNAMNNEGDSVLHVLVKATFHKKISNRMVEKLIIHGADRKLTDSNDSNPAQLAFQVNNHKLGTLLLFYVKPDYLLDDKPSHSKSPTAKSRESSYISSFTTSIQRKSPSILGSLIKFITGPFTATVYEFDGGKGEGPLSSRRYYDDITISEVNFPSAGGGDGCHGNSDGAMLIGEPRKLLENIKEDDANEMEEILEELKLTALDDMPEFSHA